MCTAQKLKKTLEYVVMDFKANDYPWSIASGVMESFHCNASKSVGLSLL
jgi:hypothetical protein